MCVLHVIHFWCIIWLFWSSFVQNNPTVQRHADRLGLIGDFKLPIGVHISVNGCLSLFVSPVRDWRPVQSVLCVLLNDS